MNLVQIRELFREASGRYDLVHDDLSDNGADRYINEAIRWLDRRTNINRSWGTHPQWVPHGTWITQFPTARAVREVNVDGVNLCIVKPVSVMTEIHRSHGELQCGIPHTCAVLATGVLEQGEEPIPAIYYHEIFNSLQLMSDDQEEVNTLIFNCCIPEGGAMISVVGMFYQIPLIGDNDANFWSRNHPTLLVNAAIRQTYVTSGNRELLAIINEEIDKDLVVISMDRIEEDVYGAIQMRSNY